MGIISEWFQSPAMQILETTKWKDKKKNDDDFGLVSIKPKQSISRKLVSSAQTGWDHRKYNLFWFFSYHHPLCSYFSFNKYTGKHKEVIAFLLFTVLWSFMGNTSVHSSSGSSKHFLCLLHEKITVHKRKGQCAWIK